MFDLLERGDVGIGADQAGDGPVGAVQHRFADDRPLRLPAGTGAQRFHLAPAAFCDEPQVLRVVALGFLFRKQLEHVAADRLLARKADHLEPGIVDRDVAPLRVLEVHRVGVFVDHRARQQHLVAQTLFLRALLGDVEARNQHADGTPLRIIHDAACLQVAPPAMGEILRLDRSPGPAFESSAVGREHGVGFARREPVVQVRTDHFVAGRSDVALPRAVHEQIPAGRVAQRERNRNRVEQVADELDPVRELDFLLLARRDIDEGADVAQRAAVGAGKRNGFRLHPEIAAVGLAGAIVGRLVRARGVPLASVAQLRQEQVPDLFAVFGVDQLEEKRPCLGVGVGGVPEHLLQSLRIGRAVGDRVPVEQSGLCCTHEKVDTLLLLARAPLLGAKRARQALLARGRWRGLAARLRCALQTLSQLNFALLPEP